MINALHLLWIIPLSGILLLMTLSGLWLKKAIEIEKSAYKKGYSNGYYAAISNNSNVDKHVND